MIENINLSEYLHDIELVVVGGESDKNARPLYLNSRLSFLCKDREEQFEAKPYNDKNKYGHAANGTFGRERL